MKKQYPSGFWYTTTPRAVFWISKTPKNMYRGSYVPTVGDAVVEFNTDRLVGC